MPEPIQLLEAQSAATRQIVQSLSDTDLAKDSPGCPGWTLKDVVAHLATGAQMFEAIARGTLDGANWMPERQRRLAEHAALPAGELRQRYAEADASLIATFRGLSPEERQAMRRHPSAGETPVERFIFMRISETAVHGWDIRAGVEANPRLDAPATPSVVQGMLDIFPTWFVADKIAGLHRTYRFLVDGQTHTLAIADGKAAWRSAGPESDATLTLDAGDFLLLMTGRLSSDQLISSGRAEASGDVDAAKELSSLFRAYGGR